MPEITLNLDQCDADAIRDLLADRAGRALLLDDAHELLGSLVELRDVYEGKTRAPGQDGLLFRAVPIGGAVLHSPTLAARIAFQRLDTFRVPAEWAESGQEYGTLCAAWILAHARDIEALAGFVETTAPALVAEFAARLSCTSHELSVVVADLTSNGYPPLDPGTPSKKAQARPTSPPSWSVWPNLSRAARRATGFARCLRATCTGSAKRLRSGRAKPKKDPTPRNSAPTIPASTRANAGSASSPN